MPLVENGYIDHEVSRIIAKEYLELFRQQGVDTVIMGCTHYPLLRKIIAEVMGPQVELIDPGAETARYVRDFLARRNQLTDDNRIPQYKYFVSDSTESFSRLGSLFLEKEITNSVEKIDIEKY